MNRYTLRQSFILLITAVIWGTSFVWQSEAGQHVAAFTFNALRFGIGALVLIPVICFLPRTEAGDRGDTRMNVLPAGILCGAALFAASSLQQAGITAGVPGGKAGFVTALYIVLVPILSIFIKKRVGKAIWIGVALAVVGLYFLCIPQNGFFVGYADILVLLSAFAYAVHILAVDHFAQDTDGICLSAVQFASASMFSAVAMSVSERPDDAALLPALRPIILSGVLSCGMAFTLQTIGQKGINPTLASLIMSLESLVAVIAGWLILGDALSGREIAGCALMSAAIVIAQLSTAAEKP